jgi:internalin A
MSELALRLIAENKKTKAKTLDLGNCGLTEVPEEVGELVWLEELYIGSRLTRYSLQRKNLKHNTIQFLPNDIVKLKKLKILDCSYLKLISNFSLIEELVNLKELNIDYTAISDLKPIKKLNKLKRLDLRDTKVSDLFYIGNLLNITHLLLKGTNVIDLKSIENLINLEYLDIRRTKVTKLPSFEKLNKIKRLSLDSTLISDLYPIIPLLKLIPLKIDGGQNGIILSPFQWNNRLLNPPLEIVKQGNAAILQYFAAREKQGTEILTEAKIVLVGAGESGKTTLIQKLLNPEHPVPNQDDKRTEGVKITQYPIRKGQPDALTAHIWDFGGQELYHSTHQFFLTPDTLYLLLNDNRKNDTDFYYWLNILALRAGDDCPILTIFNAKDNAPRQIVPDETLFQHFPGLLREAIDVDFADKDLRRFIVLKERIEQHFAALPALGKPFPAYWVKVREALTLRTEEHITWRQFRDLCRDEQIETEAEMRTIAQTLHNLGILLWFPEVFGLDDLLVLQPQWCIDAVYKALDTKEVSENFGQFTEAELHLIWRDDRYRSQCNRLLKLMQHFDLCYPLEGSQGAYIAPQLLDLHPNPDPTFSAKGGITHRYEYEFMPAGLLTRFIARMSRHIHAPYIWRTGVTLHWEDSTIAEVTENQYGKVITIRVAGPERKRRLSEMRQTLESIHSGFRGLKYTEKVACNCPDCVNDANATTFSLKELEDFAKHGEEMTCHSNRRKKVPAQSILDGIEYHDTPRIFISYACEDKHYKDEFMTMLAPLTKKGDWKVWHEEYLLAGDVFNTVVLKQFSEANVIILLLTAKFFSSDDKWDIEMSRAIERHKQGNALVIGVVVSPCMWEETPFRMVQMLPRDGVTVDSVGNRDAVWKEVVVKVKEAIAAREKRGKGY